MPSFNMSSERKFSAAIQVSFNLLLSVLGLGQSGKLKKKKKDALALVNTIVRKIEINSRVVKRAHNL